VRSAGGGAPRSLRERSDRKRPITVPRRNYPQVPRSASAPCAKTVAKSAVYARRPARHSVVRPCLRHSDGTRPNCRYRPRLLAGEKRAQADAGTRLAQGTRSRSLGGWGRDAPCRGEAGVSGVAEWLTLVCRGRDVVSSAGRRGRIWLRVHVASPHRVALDAQHLGDRVDDPSLPWMRGTESSDTSFRSVGSTALATRFGPRWMPRSAKPPWCWRAGVCPLRSMLRVRCERAVVAGRLWRSTGRSPRPLGVQWRAWALRQECGSCVICIVGGESSWGWRRLGAGGPRFEGS
jgi:hypothetical protein